MLFSLHFVFLSVAAVHYTSNAEGCLEYRGEQTSSSTGKTCLNWIHTVRDYDTTTHTDSQTGVGDHNYCRNPDSSAHPWCYVAGPDQTIQRQSCDIDTCKDESPTAATEKADSLPGGASDPQTGSLEPPQGGAAAALEPPKAGAAAVQPVVGISQRVRTGPKQKKDLGTTGYVLGILMMAIIIVLGVGISLGYFYKRGRDLKKQHDQRMQEREMQRITLPLSAFSNPTCELVDENTVVIVAEEQTPTQEGMEGGDPLMGQEAGTPGA